MLATIRKKFPEYFVVTLLFTGMLYAAVTSWQNDVRLKTVSEDIKGIKKSMVSMLLESKPDKPAILKDLLSDASFSEGVNRYKAGNFTAAYEAWKASAASGNRNSLYAIDVATDLLEEKAQSPNLSDEELKKITEALKYAASIKVKERGGIYYIGGEKQKSRP